MQVTGEQLKEIAYRKRITRWQADACATCNYPIMFLIGEEIKHDPGCHCSDIETHRPIRYQSSSWELIADYINTQTDLDKLKEIKNFWNL